MKILITGGNGFLGKELYSYLKHNFEVTSLSKQDLDLTNSQDLEFFLKDKYFDVLIHTAIKGGTRLIKDEPSFVHENCLMHYNILKNISHFGKYISFGSGAELDRSQNINKDSDFLKSFPSDPYGMSKSLIAKSGYLYDKFYNLRIFNVFNQNELDTRMIKYNILRYIKKEPITIHQNKIMDFIHMDDLFKIVKYYIINDNLPKQINCVYKEKYSLLEIAQIINSLDNYKVEIKINKENMANSYIGNTDAYSLGIDLSDLQTGIAKTFNLLKNTHSV